MRVGIGLPNSVPGCDPGTMLAWARRADEGPFSSLGVVDRLVWECYEPMTALAAAAGVTERIRLATTIVISPLRETAALAHETATIHHMSGGRLTVGIALGARADDYAAAGTPGRRRGARLTEQAFLLRRHWNEDAIGRPGAEGEGPELLVGGGSDPAFLRAARYAHGYVHGGGPPRAFERAASSMRAAWYDLGRPGAPRLWGQGYFALGDDAGARGRDYMRAYYAFTGPFAERIAEGLLTTPQAVVGFVRGYAEAGCDELVLMPAVSDLDQVDRLADVLTGA